MSKRKIIFTFDDDGMIMQTEGYVNEEGQEEEGKLSLDDAFDVMSALAYLMKQNGIELDKAFEAIENAVKAVEDRLNEEESFDVQKESGE